MAEAVPAPFVAPPPPNEGPSHRYVTDDALLDGLGDDAFKMEDAGPEPVNAYESPAEDKRDEPPVDPATSEPEPEETAVEEAVDAAAEEALQEPEPEKADPWNGKGTREKPLTLKDLPEDRFLKLKVDGEIQLINLREAVEGSYMRPQAFDRLLSKANAAKDEATRIARDAVDHQQRFRDGFDQWIRDPAKVYAMMLENHEEVLEQVAVKYAELRKAEREDPMARQQRVFAAQQRKLEAERQRTQAERQEWENQRARAQAVEAATRELKPGYDAGLEELGLAKNAVTDELATHIRALLRVTSEKKGGAPLTAADVKSAVVRAGRYLAAQAAQPPAPPPARKPVVAPPARPRPGPAPMATPTRPAPSSNGSRFDSMSQARRFQDPDFFLDGL